MPRSRTFKLVHTFYLLVIAVLITLLFVEHQSEPAETSNSELSEQIASMNETLDSRIDNLYRHIDLKLEATRTELAAQRAVSQPSHTAPPASTHNPPVDSIVPSDPDAEETSSSGLGSTDYARMGSAILDDFEARHAEFEMQSVDPDWAYPSYDRLQELFSQDDYLRQLHLADIECRSSICKVDISVSDPQSINPVRLLQALNQINDDAYQYRLISRPFEHSYQVLLQRTEEADDGEETDPSQ